MSFDATVTADRELDAAVDAADAAEREMRRASIAYVRAQRAHAAALLEVKSKRHAANTAHADAMRAMRRPA